MVAKNFKIFIDEETQMKMVKNDLDMIKYIYDPTEKVQLFVVRSDPEFIKFIRNSTERVKMSVIKMDPDNLHYIANPSEKVQLAAVRINGGTIEYISNPSEKVQLAAIKDNPYSIRYIRTDYISQNVLEELIRNLIKDYDIEPLMVAFYKCKDPNRAYNDLPDDLRLFLELNKFWEDFEREINEASNYSVKFEEGD